MPVQDDFTLGGGAGAGMVQLPYIFYQFVPPDPQRIQLYYGRDGSQGTYQLPAGQSHISAQELKN